METTGNAKNYELKVFKRNSNFKCEKIQCAEDGAKYARQFYFDDLVIYESFFIICMNNNNMVQGWAKISSGGITATVVDLRIIAKYAIDTLATSVILVHNHPSGRKQPSEQDIKLTHHIERGLKTLDIQLLDHIILTENEYYSLSENGQM